MSSRNQKRPAQAGQQGKKKGGAPGGGKGQEEGQRENILQAVVLTDSYQTRFRPMTLEGPRCLLPVANIPLIEYTLEFLSLTGVEDVFIFCSAHANKVEEYIRNSKWNKASSPFKTCQIVMSPSSMSVGDAMRELDGKSLITTDFLLVNGDFVSNLPLEGILAEHRRRRIQDKNAIMTMILREAGKQHRSKDRGEIGVFVIDESTQRCVHYDEIRPGGDSEMLLPSDLLKQSPQLRIRTDLVDCHMDICSPDVPALFTENFDYQQIRRHFLHGILTDHELYGKTIHAHIVTDHYAARVRSLQTYDAVSRDIMARWTFPLVPDSNLTDYRYTLERGNIYKEDKVVLARSSLINRNVILGRNTTVGEGTIISNSVLGNNVRIGNNVVLDRVYIWDDVSIGSGCKIQNAIIASAAVVGNECIIEPGSVISYRVKVPDGTTVNRLSKLTSYRKRTENQETPLEGSEYENSDSESESEAAAAALGSLAYSTHHLNLSDASFSTLPDDDSGTSDYESEDGKDAARKRSDSAVTRDSADDWYKEASGSLLNAMENGHPVEVASLELNGLRMTANASWHQVRRAVIGALLSRIEQVVAAGIATPQAAAKVLTAWAPLVKRCLHERADRVDFLLLAQKECVGKKTGESLLLNVVQKLYDPIEIVEEEDVEKWWTDPKSSEGEDLKMVRRATGKFVEWLREAEEEESEEESEEEEEESDEE